MNDHAGRKFAYGQEMGNNEFSRRGLTWTRFFSRNYSKIKILHTRPLTWCLFKQWIIEFTSEHLLVIYFII